MRVAFNTHPGKVRECNEDGYLIDEEIGLVMITDGVGGQRGGEVASQIGAQVIQQTLKASLVEGRPNIEGIIQQAFDCAHQEILSRATRDLQLEGMATTVVMGLYQDGKLFVAHVGDSRAYLINSRGIVLLTEDHSLVTNMVKAGIITEKEAKNHKMRHIITQCLGCPEYFGPDIKIVTLDQDDTLLLCSDGLTDMVNESKIRRIIRRKGKNIKEAADKLVAVANRKGGLDNITVILLHMA